MSNFNNFRLEKPRNPLDGLLLKRIGRVTCDLPPQFSGQARETSIEGSAEEDCVRMRLYHFARGVLKTVTLMDIQRSPDDPSAIKDINVEKFNRYEIGRFSFEAEPLVMYNYSPEKSSGLNLLRTAIVVSKAAAMTRASQLEPGMPGIGTLDD